MIMKSSILTFFLSLILGTTLAHGAVIMVSPGQSVQAAINSASSGDEIVLQAGSYNEDLNITGKSLTLRAFSLPWVVKTLPFPMLPPHANLIIFNFLGILTQPLRISKLGMPILLAI